MSTIQEQLDQALNNVPLVHTAGVEAGKKAEYDAFWDSFQENGERRSYQAAFACWWGDGNSIKVKYPIIFGKTTALNTFWGTDIHSLSSANISLDITQVTNMNSMFQGYSDGTQTPSVAHGVTNIDIPLQVPEQITDLSLTFSYNTKLKTITQLGLHKNLKYTNTFAGSGQLQTLLLLPGSVIGNTFSCGASGTLSAESAKGILEALYDYSEEGGTYTIKLHKNVWTRLNNTYTPPQGETWEEYASLKGWTT